MDNSTTSVSTLDILAEIDAIRKECAEPNWDGYDAHPVTDIQAARAKQFYKALGDLAKGVEVCPDPHGDIDFEWYIDKEHTLYLSIDGEGKLSFIVVIGNDRSYGERIFYDNVIPKDIKELIERLQKEE